MGRVSSQQPEQSGSEAALHVAALDWRSSFMGFRLEVKVRFCCRLILREGWGAPRVCWTPATMPNLKGPSCRTATEYSSTPGQPAPLFQNPPTAVLGSAAAGVRNDISFRPATHSERTSV